MTTAVATQRLVALRKANEHRTKGAKFRAETRRLPHAEGCAVLAEVLGREDIPGPIASLRLGPFLDSANQLGPRKTNQVIHLAGLIRHAPNLRVGDLTRPERLRIANVLQSFKKAA